MNCPPLSVRWTKMTYAQNSIRTIQCLGIFRSRAMQVRVMRNFLAGWRRRNKVVIMALLYLYAGLGGLGCGFCILHYPLTRQGIDDTVGELTEGSDPLPSKWD